MNFEQALKTEKIRNVMVPRGITVPLGTEYGDVIRQLQEKKKFCAVIMDGKKVVGIFTERDVLHKGLLSGLDVKTPIEDAMTPNPTVIDMDDTLAVAIRLMHEGRHRHLPIVNSKKEFLGLISVRDIIYYLSENYPCDVYNLPPDTHKFGVAPEGA